MDWLSQWGEMTCHWQDRWIRFQLQGNWVQLQGLADKPTQQLQEMTVDQIEKSVKGNDIWATAVVSFGAQEGDTAFPQVIQTTLDQFQDVFQERRTFLRTGLSIMPSHCYLTVFLSTLDPTGILLSKRTKSNGKYRK